MERDWKSLPIELLRNILCRLFFEDATSFSLVCKDWKFGASDLSLSFSPVEFPMPSQWLMFSSMRDTTFEFFNPFYNVFYQCDIPELSSAMIKYCKDGWLLMAGKCRSVFFFNPFTRERIDLPDYPYCDSYDGICFSSAPTSPECVVFMSKSLESDLTSVDFIWRGEERWTSENYTDDEDFHSSYSCPVFHNGKFYCLARDGHLGVSDAKPDEDGYFWEVLDKPQPPEPISKSQSLVGECYLMEYDGQLLSAFVEFNGEKVSLYTLDESIMKWKRVKDLGDNMLFVSNCSTFVAKKMADRMENKIYFPRFYDGDAVFYSLETSKFETFRTNFSSNSLLQTREKLHCCWIEPNFERTEGVHVWTAKPEAEADT